jgi:hypothetical protein
VTIFVAALVRYYSTNDANLPLGITLTLGGSLVFSGVAVIAGRRINTNNEVTKPGQK